MNKKTREGVGVSQKALQNNEIMVITSDAFDIGIRGSGLQSLKIDELATNVKVFVQQIGKILETTPREVGEFSFEEFEINAEINADGTLAILGSGIHAGAKGGLRFVFRRKIVSDK